MILDNHAAAAGACTTDGTGTTTSTSTACIEMEVSCRCTRYEGCTPHMCLVRTALRAIAPGSSDT